MKRHPLTWSNMPQLWLFSDERLQNRLVYVVASLPVGSGVVFRHDDLPPHARYRLFRRVMRAARARQLTILLADRPATACRWGAHGVHMRHHLAGQSAAHGVMGRRDGLILSMPVHDCGEAVRARKMGADLVFISPLYATRSHDGAPHLGRAAWLRLARSVGGAHLAALGGMSAASARALNRQKGGMKARIAWAGIDALDQQCSIRRAKLRG